MELILDDTKQNIDGIKKCHQTVLNVFKSDVELVNYWGPVQMCVFCLEYYYLPKKYKIKLECERGFLDLSVENDEKRLFRPWMIFPEARHNHFEDVDNDISQLIELTYQAIEEGTIIFPTQDETDYLLKTIRDKE